jgi:hypothetical protein
MGIPRHQSRHQEVGERLESMEQDSMLKKELCEPDAIRATKAATLGEYIDKERRTTLVESRVPKSRERELL